MEWRGSLHQFKISVKPIISQFWRDKKVVCSIRWTQLWIRRCLTNTRLWKNGKLDPNVKSHFHVDQKCTECLEWLGIHVSGILRIVEASGQNQIILDTGYQCWRNQDILILPLQPFKASFPGTQVKSQEGRHKQRDLTEACYCVINYGWSTGWKPVV